MKRVGDLVVYDNGINGMSYKWHYFDEFQKEHIEYVGISGDDMLDYPLSELLPNNFRAFRKEEQDFFLAEFSRIKKQVRHKDYYDPCDNTWKNY